LLKKDETQRKALINKANSLGFVQEDAGLEDILTLNVTDILNRRLQSAVSRRGYADTPKEARQIVTHGHVYVDGNRVKHPRLPSNKGRGKNYRGSYAEPEPEEQVEDVEESEEETEAEDESEETEKGE